MCAERLKIDEMTRQSAPPLSSTLPSDLSAWLDKSSLVKLTAEAIQGTPWSRPEGRFLSEGGQSYAPQSLMTLMIYCHATGSQDLQAFECSLERDEALRFFCAQIPPDANTLRQFRHIHRELIVRILERLLERAWESRPGAARACTDTKLDLENAPTGAQELTDRPDFHRDAVERVQQGIFLECIARDV
jgi:transposase